MSYELTGKLVEKYETIQRKETFKTREFVIEKSDEFNGRTITNYIKFQCVQDKTALLDKYSIGEQLKVHFNIKGTKWSKDGRDSYITNLDAWRIESVSLNGGPIDQSNSSGAYFDIPTEEGNDDILPF